jgi:hypothetical protein
MRPVVWCLVRQYRLKTRPEKMTPTSTLSHSPNDAVIPNDATLSIGKAPNSSSLVHSILEAYGKEILEFAGDQFLDLAIAMRLKTINARDHRTPLYTTHRTKGKFYISTEDLHF